MPYLGQSTAESAGLFRSQVKRKVLLVLVVFPESLALLEVEDGKNAGNALADVGASLWCQAWVAQ
jgi:hypothetical protein